MTAFECNVSADLFRRALSCASTEETRYYLCGVHVEPAKGGGALLVATDGHRLICLRDPNGTVTGTGIVKADAATIKALAARPKPRTRYGTNMILPRLVVADGRLRVEMDGDPVHLQAQAALIDGSFPDWRRVVPAVTDKVSTGAFNAAYVLAMAKALSGGGEIAVKMYADDPSSPALAYGAEQTVEGFGVLMPMHFPVAPPPGLPAWAKESAV